MIFILLGIALMVWPVVVLVRRYRSLERRLMPGDPGYLAAVAEDARLGLHSHHAVSPFTPGLYDPDAFPPLPATECDRNTQIIAERQREYHEMRRARGVTPD
jgi:hypothetical protein